MNYFELGKWVVLIIGLFKLISLSREAEREKLGRKREEDKNRLLHSELSRVEADERRSAEKIKTLQNKLSIIDPSNLSDDQLNRLYEDPHRYVSSDTTAVERPTKKEGG